MGANTQTNPMPTVDSPRKPWLSWVRRCALWGLGATLALTFVTVVALRVFFHGQRGGDYIAGELNSRIRGQVKIRSVEWTLGALTSVVTTGWLPVTVRGLEVYDDDGVLVLRSEKTTGELFAPSGVFDRDVVVRNLKLVCAKNPKGDQVCPYAHIREVLEPYPIHIYDQTVVSIISAFYPKQSEAFRAGVSAHVSQVYDLQDYHIENATIDFDFPERFTGRVEGVTATNGFLYSNGRDPLSRKLYYSLTPTAARGELGLFGNRIAMEDIKVTRLAQLPTNWPRDTIARDVTWAATARTPEGATIDLRGAFLDYWDNWLGGDYDVVLNVNKAGGLARRLSLGYASGDKSRRNTHCAWPVVGLQRRTGCTLCRHFDPDRGPRKTRDSRLPCRQVRCRLRSRDRSGHCASDNRSGRGWRS